MYLIRYRIDNCVDIEYFTSHFDSDKHIHLATTIQKSAKDDVMLPVDRNSVRIDHIFKRVEGMFDAQILHDRLPISTYSPCTTLVYTPSIKRRC